MKLTILGCGSALPAKRRNPTSQLLSTPDGLFLIDCGEGTQLRLRQEHVKFQSISHILISHMHGDHYLGLIGLLSSMNLLGRKKAITLIGPEALEDLVKSHSRYSSSIFQFPIHFQVTRHSSPFVVYESEKMLIESIPLKHRIATTGFLFKEKLGPRKLIKEKLEFFNVPIKFRVPLTKGEDFVNEEGEVIANERLTRPPKTPSSYAYCSDTAFLKSIPEQIQGCTLLYHEATFKESEKARAKKTQHSTAAQAAEIASLSGVQRLILGHFSARYTELDELLAEAEAVFPSSSLALEGMVIDIDKTC